MKVAILTGSTKTKERKGLHKQLENGEIDILIGTHALLEDKVIFKNLGFVVIEDLKESGNIIYPLLKRTYGRILSEDLKDSLTGKLLLPSGTMITRDILLQLKDS